MSRAASGDFGGERPPAPDGVVSFDIRRADDGDGWEARGGEPNFAGVGDIDPDCAKMCAIR